MKKVRTSVDVGLAVIAVLAVVAATGCSSDKESSEQSTQSSSSAESTTAAASSAASPSGTEADYSSLLIKPSDIGPNAFADGPPVPNPSGVVGVGQTFKNPDGYRTIVDTIGVFGDPSAAAQTVPAMKDTIDKKIPGAAQQPVDVGSNGFMVAGVSPDKNMEISEVVFTEGKALVDLEFDCSLGNPTPSDVVLDLARKQDAAVKNGLPS